MSIEASVDIVRNLIVMALTLMGPFLGATMALGVSISLIQSITSIQDQTLTFVPKVFCLGGLVVALAAWVLRQMMEFTLFHFEQMANVLH